MCTCECVCVILLKRVSQTEDPSTIGTSWSPLADATDAARSIIGPPSDCISASAFAMFCAPSSAAAALLNNSDSFFCACGLGRSGETVAWRAAAAYIKQESELSIECTNMYAKLLELLRDLCKVPANQVARLWK